MTRAKASEAERGERLRDERRRSRARLGRGELQMVERFQRAAGDRDLGADDVDRQA
jgi:hypothetical protein